MIDKVVDNLYFGLKSLRHAQKHLNNQDISLQGFISASNYFNNFKDTHKDLYNWIIEEYDKVHDQYIRIYHKNGNK
jgi:NADPH-dependent curcumin reductase CurA